MESAFWYDMNDGEILAEIGQRIKDHRLGRNLSQEKLAKRIGVSRVTIHLAEKGQNLSLLTFIQIARELSFFSLDGFIPLVDLVSAKEIYEKQEKRRKRAYGKRSKKD